MANTRQSAKRAKQERKRQDQNTLARSQTKSALKKAIQAIKERKPEAKDLYVEAVRALDKAGRRGTIPPARSSRKVSRLTEFAKRTFPDSLNFKN